MLMLEIAACMVKSLPLILPFENPTEGGEGEGEDVAILYNGSD